jgi:hypothetical protein
MPAITAVREASRRPFSDSSPTSRRRVTTQPESDRISCQATVRST